ncbi:HK97 gp10 family phage protein [Oenococcus sicerae]|uniref:HK97 gp10 family phage protein n=1 Tax=Oenococcus sicerae TaxID=2203724 RepID=A0AAJ1VLK0_9LACO|nr:HK97 gp10 family phage protein [Oenococcus sicerae]
MADAIVGALQDYTTEVEEKLQKVELTTAKEGVSELKNGGGYKERTGSYTKGWAQKKQGRGRVIYNRTDYQLTHLLEFGHATRNGGRTRAFPHIKPVDNHVAELLVQKTREVLS